MMKSLLPTQRALLTAVIALISLMALTRGDVLGATFAVTLHDASWAVFLLGGMLLRRWAWLTMFAVLALALDMSALCQGTLALGSCLRPSYPALMLSWGVLWFAGRSCRSLIHNEKWASVAIVSVLATVMAYYLSNIGFYLFSGFYPSLSVAGFADMALPHFVRALVTTQVYVLGALTLLVVIRYWRGPSAPAKINRDQRLSDQ